MAVKLAEIPLVRCPECGRLYDAPVCPCRREVRRAALLDGLLIVLVAGGTAVVTWAVLVVMAIGVLEFFK